MMFKNKEEQKALKIIDKVVHKIKKDEYEYLIENASTLKGMLLGYIYEANFQKLMKNIKGVSNIFKPNDHDRTQNKADLVCTYKNKIIKFQVKSISTDSIRFKDGKYTAKIQNDASDKRKLKLPNGEEISTTNCKYGEYDVLVVCLVAFTGHMDFCFKLNSNCTPCSNPKIKEENRKYLMSSREKITYPLEKNEWTMNIRKILKLLCK